MHIAAYGQSLSSIKGNAGLLLTNVSFSDDMNSQKFFENVTKIGLTVSASKKLMTLSFAELHGGAGLDYYSWKAVDNASSQDVASYNALYLDFHAFLKRNVTTALNISAGLAYAIGINGKQVITLSGNEYAIFDDNALSRNNFNLLIIADYQLINLVGVFAEYRLGLMNIEGKWNSGNQVTTLGSFRLGVCKQF